MMEINMTARELIAKLEKLSEEKKDLQVYTENFDYIDRKAKIEDIKLSTYYDHPDRFDIVFLVQGN